MNDLEINMETQAHEVVLRCSGRLDANRTAHLNDYIDRLVRDGQYHISLDMAEIEYLSSAGIRSLVSQYKNLKAVNGHFYISSMSDNVSQVLNMVGMAEMLCQKPQQTEVPQAQKAVSDQALEYGFSFHVTPTGNQQAASLSLYGKPELVLQSGFKASDARLVHSEENQFAIGLGAIGQSFSECENRFGEYLMLGKNIAYLPADGSKKPDYMVSSGQLIASLTELYGLHLNGNFTHLVRFDPAKEQSTIGLSQLADSMRKLSGFSRFAVVMLAESGGLIGTSLNSSPVGGKKIFSFPEVKDSVNFTTEPAHCKMLSLSAGIFDFSEDAKLKPFLRPLQANTAECGHIHTCVFPYVPLKKTAIDLNETISFLFNNSELTDVLHLTNDSREITGLGESQFVQGFCWIAPVESVTVIPTK